ncbi:MAG: T9SS type A sorting domain-containing protein [Flavobacteriales bacterium]|nr:T9SS type A sorting domain-containing protein [Flavobacteriales bacterium]
MKTRILILTIIIPLCNLYGQWTNVTTTNTTNYQIKALNDSTVFIGTHAGLLSTSNSFKTVDWCSANEIIHSFDLNNELSVVKCSFDLGLLQPRIGITSDKCKNIDYSNGIHSVSFDAISLYGDTIYTNLDNSSLIRSTDFGISWDTLKIDSLNGFVKGIEFLSFDIGIILIKMGGTNGRQLLRTTDAGNTWVKINPGFDGIVKLYRSPNGILYVSGQSGLVAHSKDFGLSWVKMGLPIKMSLVSVHFISDSVGYVSGGNSVSMDFGKVYRTRNGGQSWDHVSPVTNTFFTDVYFINDSVGYLTSHDGRIFKTTNGGGPSVPDTTIQNPVDTSSQVGSPVLQNHQIKLYPNPSKGELNVSWTFATPENSKLIFYDLQGRILQEKAILPEQSTVQLNMQHLTAGMYFISLTTPNGVEVLRWEKE